MRDRGRVGGRFLFIYLFIYYFFLGGGGGWGGVGGGGVGWGWGWGGVGGGGGGGGVVSKVDVYVWMKKRGIKLTFFVKYLFSSTLKKGSKIYIYPVPWTAEPTNHPHIMSTPTPTPEPRFPGETSYKVTPSRISWEQA